MMKSRLLAVLFGFILLTWLINLQPPAQAQDQNPQAKLAPWVVEHTKDNQTAEFLVVLADQADLSAADRLATKAEKGAYVFRTLLAKAEATQAPVLEWLKANQIEHQSFYIVNMVRVKGNLDVALALAARPEVARIEGNPLIRNQLGLDVAPAGQQPDEITVVEPGIAHTQAPQVWAMGYTGQGAVVGGGDTGYRWDHNALKPHYRGWNGATANHDYNWHDSIHTSSGSCPGNSAQPCDDDSHGTHTVGTAVGDDGAGRQIGMAPGAKWIGCRNMDQGNGTPATYTECFQFFLAPYPVSGTPAQGDPTRAPDVTTNSWGCPPSEGCTAGTWGVIQTAMQAQRAAGIVTVVAAGNSGSSCSTVSSPPSFFPEALTVGALSTGSDSIASFSSRGPVTIDGSNRTKPDIAAPGTLTVSAIHSGVNSYGSKSGTSMATPHVAGAVALIISAQPKLRGQVDAIEGILKDSAFHIDSTSCSSSGWPNNVFGYGRLNAKAAADMALTVAAPQSQAFSAVADEGVLNVTAPANASWTATTGESWITIFSGSGSGNGTVTFAVRDNLSATSRVGTISLARRSYTIRQQGMNAGGCSYALTPLSQAFGQFGGSGSFAVAAGEDCVWAAHSNVNWVTITSDNGGTGTGTVTFTVAPNPSGVGRKARITVAGKEFNVKQR